MRLSIAVNTRPPPVPPRLAFRVALSLFPRCTGHGRRAGSFCAVPFRSERASRPGNMNNTQPPTVTLASRLRRLVVAGVISTFIYCSLTLAIWPWLWFFPFSPPEAGALYWIRLWVLLLLLMLSIPGFALGLPGGYIINPNSATDTGMALTIVMNLLLWFSLGAIPASIFRKNRLVAAMWIVLVGIVEILGWIVASILFRGLQL